MNSLRRPLVIVLAACSLAACSSGSSDRAEIETTQPEVQPDPTPPVVVEPTGPLKAADIMKALAEKSFTYTRGSRSGTISYYGDGTFNYNEAGKGEGSGVWQASDGKLCEAFNPTSFLPKGTRSECHPFSASGGSYTAGTTRLSPA